MALYGQRIYHDHHFSNFSIAATNTYKDYYHYNLQNCHQDAMTRELEKVYRYCLKKATERDLNAGNNHHHHARVNQQAHHHHHHQHHANNQQHVAIKSAACDKPAVAATAATAVQPTHAKPVTLYPLNSSMDDELSRLFVDFRTNRNVSEPRANEIWEEFKHNGRDYEYCPDQDATPIVLNKKKNKKPLPTECVFCKNNGEDPKIYKSHLLKDANGKVICPILSNYTCPVCGAFGEKSHTLKYCPEKNLSNIQQLASMNTLKTLRNSTGRKRSK